jgi:hypothetical protein
VATVACASSPLRESAMKLQSTKQNELSATAPTRPRSPVRVKLTRINAEEAIPSPPENEARDGWWRRLEGALSTCSAAFIEASLVQLIACCRLPRTAISEVAVNAALAFIEGAKPRNEIEAALAMQMACNHAAIMNVFSRFHGDYGGEHSLSVGANAVARLQRSFALQVETLRRLRSGGSQVVRVEHVHFHEGAQGIIGHVGNADSIT